MKQEEEEEEEEEANNKIKETVGKKTKKDKKGVERVSFCISFASKKAGNGILVTDQNMLHPPTPPPNGYLLIALFGIGP